MTGERLSPADLMDVLWLLWIALDRHVRYVAWNLATLLYAQHWSVPPSPAAVRAAQGLVAWSQWPVTWAWWQRQPYGELLRIGRGTGPVPHTALLLLWGLRGAGAVLLLLVLLMVLLMVLRVLLAPLRWWQDRRARRPVVSSTECDLPGSATWMTAEEVRGFRGEGQTPFALGRWVPRLPDHSGWGKIARRARTLYLTLEQATEGVLLLAPPGQGKSVGIIGGALALAKAVKKAGGALRAGAPSLFYWDVAGELAGKLARALRRAGWDVLELHPYLEKGQINPLVWCDGIEWIDTFLEAWLDNASSSVGPSADGFYRNHVKTLLTAAILGLRTLIGDSATMVDVYDALTQQVRESDDAYYARVYVLLARASDGLNGANTWQRLHNNGQQFATLKAEIGRRLGALRSPKVRWFLAGHDLDLDQLLTQQGKPLAVFWQVPTMLQDLVAPVTSSVLALLMARIGGTLETRGLSATQKGGGGGAGRALIVELDEAGSGAPIYQLPRLVATLRKYNVCVRVVVQVLSQLTTNYGESGAQTILGSLGLWVVMGGVHPDDAAAVSVRLGTRRVEVTTTTITPPTRQAEARARKAGLPDPEPTERSTTRVDTRPLLEPHEIRRLRKWDRLTFTRRGVPLLTRETPYFGRGSRGGRRWRREERTRTGTRPAPVQPRSQESVSPPPPRSTRVAATVEGAETREPMVYW